MSKKLDELLAQLEAAEADLRQRADAANAEAQANRAKRERAMAAFKAATVKGDKKAMAEAQDLIKTLDGNFEMLKAQVEALQGALDSGGEPLRSIALEIKEEAQARARERRAAYDQYAARLQDLAAEYLEVVAEMGRLNRQSAGGPAWERAQHYLPRPLNVLEGAMIPSHVHENQRGPIYALAPIAIQRTYREGKVVEL
jgi:chromosome segregation ATPase